MNRTWRFVFQFPEKKPCLAGTVSLRGEAPLHEVEQACTAYWSQIFPFECPPIVKLVPGMLVFQEEAIP